MRNNNVLKGLYSSFTDFRLFFLRRLSGIAPEYVSKRLYKHRFGKSIDLIHPRNLNEKLMWLKLNRYANDSLVIQCADKYAVRDYVTRCGLSQILNELYGKWDNANDIKWELLPKRFVLKCNHGCGFNIICRDIERFNKKEAIHKLNKWLKTGSWREYAELHYRHIKPCIICEKYLEGKGNSLPVDYKFYCFNGQPLYIGNFIERNIEAGTIIRGYFDLEWKPSKYYKRWKDMDLSKFDKPTCLTEMIEYARILSKPFPFVRVDFYEVDGKVYFGELTFTPTGCLGTYYADDAYIELGNKVDISYGKDNDK